jgi:ABC-type Na+ efflux pump permease subunit
MFVMTAAPQLMNQVLEEKMQRISEVLISAVSPFQLMLGKLLAGVGVSLTLAVIYLAAIVWALNHWGVGQFVPPSAYFWILVLLVFAMLTYGAIFSALGSACTELRDAQSLMMPVMIILMVPMFAWGPILESPNGTVAVALTFRPHADDLPGARASSPGPPAWEFAAATAMCLATTIAFVWASGRIFRIGILAQSKAPSFRKLVGWVFSGG